MTVPRGRWRPDVGAALLLVAGAGLAAGALLHVAGRPGAGDLAWAVATVAGLVPATAWVLAGLRRRRLGVDLVAVLALVGALAVGEYLAGAVVALMLATGRSLESYAGRRARRDLGALVSRAPRTARVVRDGGVREVPVDQVVVGDRVLVGAGEVVPVDGVVLSRVAVIDESALTGEPLPVEREHGAAVRSGTANAAAPFDLSATASAADSTYTAIVRLVEAAEASGAPVVRLADRYAAAFLPLTLGLAGTAWAVSGDAVRAVAVLVVATPCPLLLATPVALVSGLSVAARMGVVVKGGAALEVLGRTRTVVLDKTGTVTAGRPSVVGVVAAPGLTQNDVLRDAAAVEQASLHVLGRAIVDAAATRDLTVPPGTGVTEEPGRGISGTVQGRHVRVGKDPGAVLPGWAETASRRSALDGVQVVWVVVDDALAGAVLLRDVLRYDAARTVRRLRRSGVARVVLLTGDRPAGAAGVAPFLALDAVYADQSPVAKVDVVRRESAAAVTAMVGDGVNDAPALATADVGVAVAGDRASVASEAGDVVLLTDRISRLADVIIVSRRTRRIAVQSAAGGMTLALAGMGFAAVGLLAPIAGAVLQEVIDVAAIANALRALGAGRGADVVVDPATADLLWRMRAEHVRLRPQVDRLRSVADEMGRGSDDDAAVLARLRECHAFLTDELLPHERDDDHLLYPAVSRIFGSDEATSSMTHAHGEIERLVQRIGAHLDQAGSGPLLPGQRQDLTGTLYGLQAVLAVHFAQEEEAYLSLVDEPVAVGSS